MHGGEQPPHSHWLPEQKGGCRAGETGKHLGYPQVRGEWVTLQQWKSAARGLCGQTAEDGACTRPSDTGTAAPQHPGQGSRPL